MALTQIISDYSLVGYHGSRLTDKEIALILLNGMTLQSGKTLETRIKRMINENLITNEIATCNQLQKKGCNAITGQQ